MRPFGVVVLDEVVEPGLLLEEIAGFLSMPHFLRKSYPANLGVRQIEERPLFIKSGGAVEGDTAVHFGTITMEYRF